MSSTKFVNGSRVADKVLTLVKKLGVQGVTAGEVYVNAYANGREQGHHLIVYRLQGGAPVSRAVSFSESRGSDQIVVYFGGRLMFDGHGVPNEATYRAARYFAWDRADLAAEFVNQYLSGRTK